MKQLAAVLLVIAGSCGAFAQYPTPSTPGYEPGAAGANTATSLSGVFFRGDFFNASGFFDGLYDSVERSLSSSSSTGGFGFDGGGAISASKSFSDSVFSLNYRGGYRHYPSGSFGSSGTNQNLALVYSKRFGPRWIITLDENGGIMLYSTIAYNTNPSVPPLSNPFSPSTRFFQSSGTASYRRTQRLTFTATANFFLNRYSSSTFGQEGTTGGIYSGSLTYVLTRRTSVAGTYSHDDFFYEGNAGTSHINGLSASLIHVFGRGWTAKFSAGASHVATAGIYAVPVDLNNGTAQPVPGFIFIPYDTKKFIPTFEVSLTHRFRILNVSVNALHGVNPGNGTYLTSSDTAVNGYASRAFGRKAILTAAAGFSHLDTIAQGVGHSYTQTNITAFYSRVLFPHISGYGSYSLIRYSSISNFAATTDNRFTFGLSFSLRNVPFTLF